MNTQRPPAVTVALVLLALLSVVNMVPPSLMASPAEAAEVPAFVTYLSVILGVVGLVAAYGLLIRINRERQKLLTYGLSDHYRNIFQITRLDDAIGIYDSEEEAVRAADSM